ncbi:MAG: hypothetical protein ABEJ23_02045 [Haloarculaceae archaeon]
MSGSVAGALVAAGALGVTHAIEPDHVAGIASLTSRDGDARLSALVGACFSVGHVALVVAWLGAGWLLVDGLSLSPGSLPGAGLPGRTLLAAILGTLGVLTAVGGLRSVVRAHASEHAHDEAAGTPHLHLPVLGARPAPDHGHGVRTYLATGVVGALFTLSPPASMLAFASTLFPAYGGRVVALAVAVYAVGITATMSAIGAGAGAVFGAAAGDARLHGAVRVLAGVAVAGVAASLVVGLPV